MLNAKVPADCGFSVRIESSMSEGPPSIRLLARQLIEQCRREVAAAWEQVEAGRRILDQSRWLLQRWAEQAQRLRLAPPPYQPRLAGSFEPLASPRQKLDPRRMKRARLRKYVAAAAERMKAEARAR